jgi:phospholipid/cholesterol/gamma-HCH transport system substrate-binding protein
VPTGPRHGFARGLSLAALVGAVALLAVVILGSGSSYRVDVLFDDAGQLVKGGRVVVGGVTVGTVERIALDDRNRARVTLALDDDALTPLHAGTMAAIDSPSLSTAAGRQVSLRPGPNNAPELGDGATIGTDRTHGTVELDALFNTLDYRTRSDLQDIIRGSAVQFGDDSAVANRGLHYLNPAVSQTQLLAGELLRDQQAFSDFIVKSAAVVSSIAPRSDDLRAGITGAAQVTERLAREDETIGALLERAPGVVRQATGTLRDVDRALDDARPVLRAARPVAPRLTAVLTALRPVARDARPALAATAALLPDVTTVLRGLPALSRTGVQAFGDASSALRGTQPIVSALRPYTPDVVSGLFDGFGGNVANYYDANGRYAHIAFSLPPDFLVQGASALGSPLEALLSQGLGRGFVNEFPDFCPGGSTKPPPDGSAPFLDPAVVGHCNPAQKP